MTAKIFDLVTKGSNTPKCGEGTAPPDYAPSYERAGSE